MGLNNISLSPRMLAALYPDVLIETQLNSPVKTRPEPRVESQPEGGRKTNPTGSIPEELPATAVPVAPPLPFLGKNEKNILVIVSSSASPYLSEGALTFLTSILAACKLGLNDVALVNWQQRDHQPGSRIMEILQSRQVLLFDVSPVDFGLPMAFPHFQIQNFDKRVYLHAPALETIEGDKALKAALWKGLKTLFCL